MDPESQEGRGHPGKLGADGNGNGNGRAMTVLLTVMCSLLGLAPFAWFVNDTITDLKIDLRACRESCENEKLRIIVDRALVDIEGLGVDPDSAALRAIADSLRELRVAKKPEPEPEPKPKP